MVAAGALEMGEIAVVWRSPPLTHGPFAVARTLPEAVKRTLGDYLAGLEASKPAAYDALNPYYAGGYARVGPDDYAGVEVLMEENVDAVRLPEAPAETGSAAAAPEPAPD
jgi:phosphonate transport system substrate-binding protein